VSSLPVQNLAKLFEPLRNKSLIGMGSGESFQLGFSGQGWVLVQPSEGRPVTGA
jgi:uncharacterized protein (AIM24 family)